MKYIAITTYPPFFTKNKVYNIYIRDGYYKFKDDEGNVNALCGIDEESSIFLEINFKLIHSRFISMYYYKLKNVFI